MNRSIALRPSPDAARFRSAGWWRDETLPGWIERHATETPARIAVRSASHAIGYGALQSAARRLASGLRTLGIGRGDVVAAQLPNSIEFLVAYLATGLCGAIFQTVHMPYRAAEVGPLLRHSGARAVIALASTKDFSPAAMMLGLLADAPALEHVIVVGTNLGGATVDGALDHAALAATPDDGAPSAARPDEPFVLLYTSGTTSAPKGVPVSFQNFLSNARMSARELELSADSILLSAAPFTHLYGLFSINLAFAAGASVALLPSFSPPALAEAIDALRPSALFTAPAHMTACRDAGLLTRERFASLSFVMISGSTCAPELARSTQDALPDGKVLQLWGMSELQAGTFTRPSDDEAARLTSVGRASPGTELRVAGAEAIDAATAGIGELQVRGSSLFGGYLDNDAANAAAITEDGWFRTGDLATLDAAGNVRIVGRINDLINRGGVKFNPLDVEVLLDRHPAVAQSAIVPMPDPALGERACCFVVLRPGAALVLDDVRAWLEQHGVGKIKWPERLEVIEAMPLTPTRKVVKGDLVRRLAGRTETGTRS